MRRHRRILPLLALGLAIAGHAQATANALSQSASHAAVCSGCHGRSSGEEVPALVRDAQALERQMLILQQAKGESAMHRLIHAYSETQIRGIAQVIAQQDKTP